MHKGHADVALREKSAPKYCLTIIDNRSLAQRLILEITFLADEIRQAWPDIKRDPIAFTGGLARTCAVVVSRRLREPNTLKGGITAFALVSFAILLTITGHGSGINTPARVGEQVLGMVELKTAKEIAPLSLSKINAGSKGLTKRANKGGLGSERKLISAHGGGGSGDHKSLPVLKGKLPQPSEMPAPVSNIPVPKNPVLPPAGIDIDAKLWRDEPFPRYGDPHSNATVPSNGPGNGGNFGDGNGLGIGKGNGSGYGPGKNGNAGGGQKRIGGGREGGDSGNPDPVLPANQVNQRARVLIKPEPQYTEEARRNQITGTVVLRVVFSRTGQVMNIRAVQTLPFGLTEQAVLAARQIRFAPAMKDGRPVSVYMQLEYNFNLY